MRSGTSGLKWLLDDHASTALSTSLGSTAITADGATGARLSELRYKPWGGIKICVPADDHRSALHRAAHGRDWAV
jgi:hypothetical protein